MNNQKDTIIDLGISIGFIILIIIGLNPFQIWMPEMIHMILMGFSVMGIALFLVFIWREKIKDERDIFVKLNASKIAYTVGVIFLVIGNIANLIQHKYDFWLSSSLAVLVVGKIIANIFVNYRN